jgi:hypothetical protein
MPDTYRICLRVRAGSTLHVEEAQYSFPVAGRDVLVEAQKKGTPIIRSNWLTLTARGFASESRAEEFGFRFRSALETAAAASRMGIDIARDLEISIDRTNVIDFDTLEATAIVSSPPDVVFAQIGELFDTSVNPSVETNRVLLLLNAALMQREPVARVVFAISAVEMLGQRDSKWSDDQKRLIEKSAVCVEQSDIGQPPERDEVADAIRRGLYRDSLRVGVHRLLTSLGLAHLNKQWDNVYDERSALFHARNPQAGADYRDLATRAVTLCGYILLTWVAQEIPAVEQFRDRFYKIA